MCKGRFSILLFINYLVIIYFGGGGGETGSSKVVHGASRITRELCSSFLRKCPHCFKK